jgi:hypothetical protein
MPKKKERKEWRNTVIECAHTTQLHKRTLEKVYNGSLRSDLSSELRSNLLDVIEGLGITGDKLERLI